jgi:hypothetical protein
VSKGGGGFDFVIMMRIKTNHFFKMSHPKYSHQELYQFIIIKNKINDYAKTRPKIRLKLSISP